jgi:type II secretory pathway component PulF
MKKRIFIFAILLMATATTFLTGCSPSYQSGGWIIPVGLIGFSGFSFYKYSKDKENKAALYVGIALLVAFAIVLLMFRNDG